MSAVLDAFQADVWQSRNGPIPIGDLSPDQASTALGWASDNAGELLRRHRERMDPAAYRVAAEDPAGWWANTELCAALQQRVDAEPSLPFDASENDVNPSPVSATLQEPSPEPLQGSSGDGHPVPSSSEVEQVPPSIDARELAVATRRAEESASAAERLRAELAATVAERDRLASERDDLASQANRAGSATAEAEALSAQLAQARADAEAARTATAEELAAAQQTAADAEARLAELEQQSAGDRDRLAEFKRKHRIASDRSTRRLNMVVTGGTAIVLLSVAVLTYVGGYYSARHYAGWSPLLAALLPLSIEAGAAVELASLVQNRRHGITSHWSTRILALGLLGMSITAMLLHATGAPDGSFRWWGYVLAAALPLELAALVRSALHTNDDFDDDDG